VSAARLMRLATVSASAATKANPPHACCQPSDALMVRMAQSAGPLVPETDFQERFCAASILSGREIVPSIPPGHCCHQKRERVLESGGSSSLTFVMA
jgi:hypothetical protein